MTNQEQSNNGEQQRAEVQAYIDQRTQWMADAVELITGDREADPLEVFPAPTEPRNATEGLPLTEAQEAELRPIAERFGVGTEQDVPGTAQIRLKEGGLVWKVEAEAAIGGEQDTNIFAGSPYRVINEVEVSHISVKYGVDMTDKTEYDMVRFVAEQQPGFVANEQDEILPFGYALSAEHELVTEPTGQLVKIGEKNGQPVMLLRVDREYFTDDEGAQKPRFQPDSAALMIFIGNVLSACGDETTAVGMDTSTTYASRVVDTMRAGLKSGRYFDVGMYGRQTLADAKNQPIAEPTAINQIPGELYALYEKLKNLQSELNQK
jgi:hypothetical protein